MTGDTILADTSGSARYGDDQVSYAAMLDALHAETAPGQFVVSPSGYVLASARALALAGSGTLGRLGVACVTAAAVGVPDRSAREDAAADRFADGLLALHCVALRRALAHTLGQLSRRTSEGRSLLTRSQIQAELADIAIEIQEGETVPEAGRLPGQRARWACDRRLTDAGRGLLRLLGASSMLIGGPGADLYLAEVAGSVYLQPEPSDGNG